MMRIAGLILLLAFSAPAFAQALFFDELGDVPVMPAMAELSDRTLVFDKPSGRIAQVTALPGPGVSMSKITAFYAQSLPEFGWRVAGAGRYVREDEALTILPLNEAGRTLVVFRLEPR